MDREADIVLQVDNLDLDFNGPNGAVHALRDVSITARAGRILGVVGESGCGKSTLVAAAMRLLAGNAEVTGGRIGFDDRDILRLSEGQLTDLRGRDISMVFQDPMTSQNPVLSVGRQMMDILYRRKELSRSAKKTLIVDMLRKVGIADPETRFDQYPHEFSGGMRQRISIAMALLVNPRLLIADEPTTALDATMEAQIVHLIRQMQDEFGGTVVFVSHNLGLIAELCDDVVIMYAGEVVERGSIFDIFENPQHPYTRRLLRCDPALIKVREPALPTIPGSVPDLRDPPKGCAFAARCIKADATCREQHPVETEGAPGHLVRCHMPGPPDTEAGAVPPEAQAKVTQQEGAPVMAVRDLRVRFRTMGAVAARLRGNADPFIDAIIGVSLDVPKGQTFGLVGESGSGKTTLVRALLGLAPIHSGSVQFEGRELADLTQSQFKSVRRDIAMMFQDPIASLSPRRTARALVAEPFSIHGITDIDVNARVGDLFDMVGLGAGFMERYPHQLSGGQARRVGVARALALSPKLILADEPTAGLDVSVQGEILNLMSELQRTLGLSYLVISHNLPVVRHVADKLGIMYLGRIVEQGPAAGIFAAPAHPYTKALLGTIPTPDPRNRRTIPSIEGEIPSVLNRPEGCEFSDRCPFAQENCRTTAPVPRDIGQSRTVSCHYPLE